jgi:hypothetical protein
VLLGAAKPVAHPRHAYLDRANPGHDRSLGQVAVAHQALAAIIGTLVDVRGKKVSHLGLHSTVISPLLAGLLLAILPDLRTRSLLEGLYNARSVDDEALRQNVSVAQGLPAKKPRSLPWWLYLLLGAAFFGTIAWLLKTGGP